MNAPVALYQRIFGEGFQLGGGDFTPDPAVMVRKSVLSSVLEQSKRLEQELGSHDRQRLDQYFTSIRQLENQLDVMLTEPPDLPACYEPTSPSGVNLAQEITQVVKTDVDRERDRYVLLALEKQFQTAVKNLEKGASARGETTLDEQLDQGHLALVNLHKRLKNVMSDKTASKSRRNKQTKRFLSSFWRYVQQVNPDVNAQ